jgi:murein DD-endopeptidase MepM/ murein hydrolase activator NlpD
VGKETVSTTFGAAISITAMLLGSVVGLPTLQMPQMGPVGQAAAGRGDKLGIDIELPYGTPVRATADGELSGAAMGAGFGRAVVLNYGHDVMRAYGHLSAIAVLAGQHMTLGQVIGYVGQTGRATDPHLQLEVQMHHVGEFGPVSAHRLCAGDKLAGNQSGC